LALPTLLFHGTEDKLTSFAASKEFMQKAGKNVQFIAYEGLYHECHNEPEKQQVLEKPKPLLLVKF
jgi:alpha-beta hydrolase superfamily lysophospholipase